MTSHATGPATMYTGSGGRPSNTRAPVQVTAKLTNSRALARSIEIAWETEPYRPNNTTELARIRCAQPHQATARICAFWIHANSSSNPRIAST
jgi:hypothetical protein